MPDWVVAISQPQLERTAVEQISRQNFVCFFPQISLRTVHRGRITSRLVPLFPRYLFVAVEACWRSLQGTRGVSGIVMMGGRPAIASQAIVDAIKARCGMDDVFLPEQAPPALLRGQRVRITDGALEGHVGIYDGMTAQQREVVLMNLLGRKTRVELAEGSLVAA